MSGSTAAFGLATQGIGSAVVLNVIFWLSLLISIPLQGYNPLYGFAAILGVLLLAIFGAVVFLLTRGEKQAAVFVTKVADRLPFVRAETVTSLVQKVADRMKILFSSSELLTRAGIWAAANWLLDAASLWVFLLAFGARISPIDVLVAYGLANILAVIPLTPSGLGVIELTIVAVLKGFGVPSGVAAAGVLSWRLVNFWLPIPFGGASYLSLRLGHPRTAAAKAAPLLSRLRCGAPDGRRSARAGSPPSGPASERTRPSTPDGDVEAEHRLYRASPAGSCVPARPSRRGGGADPGRRRRGRARPRPWHRPDRPPRGRATTAGPCASAAARCGWFEVDLPATQADKRRRLAALGIAPAGVDYVGRRPHERRPRRSARGGRPRPGRTVALRLREGCWPSSRSRRRRRVCETLRARAAPASVLVGPFPVAARRPARPRRALRLRHGRRA